MQAPADYKSIILLHKHQAVIQASDCYKSLRQLDKHQISVQASDHHITSPDHRIISSDHHITSSDQHIIIFFQSLRLTLGDMYTNQVPKNYKNGPERGPCGSVWAQTRPE